MASKKKLKKPKEKKLVSATGAAMSAWGLSQTKSRKAADDYIKGKA